MSRSSDQGHGHRSKKTGFTSVTKYTHSRVVRLRLEGKLVTFSVTACQGQITTLGAMLGEFAAGVAIFPAVAKPFLLRRQIESWLHRDFPADITVKSSDKTTTAGEGRDVTVPGQCTIHPNHEHC